MTEEGNMSPQELSVMAKMINVINKKDIKLFCDLVDHYLLAEKGNNSPEFNLLCTQCSFFETYLESRVEKQENEVFVEIKKLKQEGR